MKTIPAKKIRKAYRKLWPLMLPAQCMDSDYLLETVDNIKAIIDKCQRYKKIQFRDQIADCDNYALSLWAEFDEIWGATPGYNLPCPFGRASGLKFNGEAENHTLNTLLCDTGIYFFEPQLGQLWLADKNNDLIFLVQM